VTRLIAELKDFQLVEKEDGSDMCYRFRLGSCEDFADTMTRFKRAIDLNERIPDQSKSWLWEVKASAKNFAALDKLFDNFSQCYDIAKSQLKMF
jgi:hypothetical protein